jgi:hypothetical protein
MGILKSNVFAKKHTLSPRSSSYCGAGIIQVIKPKTDPVLFPDVFAAERLTGSFVPFTIISEDSMKTLKMREANLIVTSQMPQIGRQQKCRRSLHAFKRETK